METETKNNSGEVAVYEVEEALNQIGTDFNYRHKIIWTRAILHVALQLGWLIGMYTIFYVKLQTFLWAFVYGFLSLMSISIGAHRCYSHKSFKPTPALEIMLIAFQTVSGQNSMFTWARDHKIHHKYSDTDADPHNASRGFLFSHVGWLMTKRHRLVTEKLNQVDISDLLSNKYIMFQYKYFLQLYVVLAVAIPMSVPMYFWNETLWNAFFVAYIFRYVTTLHLTWGINSFAHLWGTKPFDKRIMAKESMLIMWITGGEGYHNYHHAFPWDYRLSEYGRQGGLATSVIDLLAFLGLAYDLKTASPDIVMGHLKRHGDENAPKKLSRLESKMEGTKKY